jgi:hypothetical protein
MPVADHLKSLPIRAIILNPMKSLSVVGLIATAALLLGTIVPALIAHSTQSFYFSEMQSRVKSKNLTPAVENMTRVGVLQARLAELDKQIASADESPTRRADIDTLLNLRRFYSAQLAEANKMISLQPFYLNAMMFIWMNAYLSLGCLAFILSPKREQRAVSISRSCITAILGFYVLYQCPVWLRNFVLNNEGRRVYSYANRDISAPNFWMQEINTLLVFILLALIWQRWIDYSNELRVSWSHTTTVSQELNDFVIHSFAQWQLSSFLLAMAFIYFTIEFWVLVIKLGDSRYVLPAVTIHALWGLSWVIISLPTAITWRNWHRLRFGEIARIYQDVDDKSEARLKLLDQLLPISPWNAAVSGIAAVGSFLIPLLMPILKHIS